MIPVLGPLPFQSHWSSTDHSGVFVVAHWCVLVLLELQEWPCFAGTTISDELRPPPPLESSVLTPLRESLIRGSSDSRTICLCRTVEL